MIPSWLVNSLVICLACIIAISLGSTLPEYDALGIYIFGVVVVGTLCVVFNDFALLLALGVTFPLSPPIPFFSRFPTVALVFAWFAIVIFFRACLMRTANYVPSCNLLLLITFLWVPVRFFLNPVHHFGATVVGGQGISGANAYFLYALAGVAVIFMGFILNSRKALVSYWIWWLRIILFFGIALTICAFVPSTQPFLVRWGMFAAGNMTDDIQRIVLLPGYGMYLIMAACCPRLFRLELYQSALLIALGLGMMVIGGNRSAVAAVIIAVPVILFVRRQSHLLMGSIGIFILGMAVLHLSISEMDSDQIPELARCLGALDSKIDESTGGTASADWRYAVWRSGITKILEAPMIGHGFGNLPDRVEDSHNKGPDQSSDFEDVLAGGEAHNGFISAAYGFGIPFALALTIGLTHRLFSHVFSALKTSSQDLELRDFHAFLAGNLATYGMIIYTAVDMCAAPFWITVGMGITMDHLTRPSDPYSPRVHSKIQITSDHLDPVLSASRTGARA